MSQLFIIDGLFEDLENEYVPEEKICGWVLSISLEKRAMSQ